MFMPLSRAAQVLAISEKTLRSVAESERGAIRLHLKTEADVHFEKVAERLGIFIDDVKKVKSGKEWLLTEPDLLALYGSLFGSDQKKLRIIAGAPVGNATAAWRVFRASPFIRVAMMAPEDRAEFLEKIDGRSPGTRHKSKSGANRKGHRVPREDGSSRRDWGSESE